MRPSSRFDIAARTHPGSVRTENQDSFVVDPGRGRFAVIDGMGGTAAGGIAADHTRRALLGDGDLVTCLGRANQIIIEDAVRNPARRGMGCVVTAVETHGRTLQIAHVGDTRAYLASAFGTEQLTRDHTITAADQEAWGLSEAQARSLHPGHGVTNDLGRRPRPDSDWIERHQVPFHRGDVLLLCTDGLHGVLQPSTVFSRLADARRRELGAADLADRLVMDALAAGGSDNVTVVVVRRRTTVDQLVTALARPFVSRR